MDVLTFETCSAVNSETIKQRHQVGLSLFSYQDDARSYKHKDNFHLPANSIGLVNGPRDVRPGNTFFEKQLLATSCLSLHPSVRMKELGSLWADFNKISSSSFCF